MHTSLCTSVLILLIQGKEQLWYKRAVLKGPGCLTKRTAKSSLVIQRAHSKQKQEVLSPPFLTVWKTNDNLCSWPNYFRNGPLLETDTSVLLEQSPSKIISVSFHALSTFPLVTTKCRAFPWAVKVYWVNNAPLPLF